jgi:hypothetical protein
MTKRDDIIKDSVQFRQDQKSEADKLKAALIKVLTPLVLQGATQEDIDKAKADFMRQWNAAIQRMADKTDDPPIEE